ncbi:Scr1 family TA system antitoxin-like transcriptional regulator [Streptomyces murinus]|uniref:Scr1 family TA system antitoxin-like transcriptional regulator n=1 Tax=Streptomyces murinus TaxID=33900 RepID=UPI00211390FA|nr:Scr1 family TA system antitoxin-like transcriptional regulator [Streptomyces murinus]
MGLLRQNRVPGAAECRPTEKALEAERHTESIEEWCPVTFPGLLQSAPYARALVRSADPAAHLGSPTPFTGDGRTPGPGRGVGRAAPGYSADRSAEVRGVSLMAASVMVMDFPDAPPLVNT